MKAMMMAVVAIMMALVSASVTAFAANDGWTRLDEAKSRTTGINTCFYSQQGDGQCFWRPKSESGVIDLSEFMIQTGNYYISLSPQGKDGREMFLPASYAGVNVVSDETTILKAPEFELSGTYRYDFVVPGDFPEGICLDFEFQSSGGPRVISGAMACGGKGGDGSNDLSFSLYLPVSGEDCLSPEGQIFVWAGDHRYSAPLPQLNCWQDTEVMDISPESFVPTGEVKGRVVFDGPPVFKEAVR